MSPFEIEMNLHSYTSLHLVLVLRCECAQKDFIKFNIPSGHLCWGKNWVMSWCKSKRRSKCAAWIGIWHMWLHIWRYWTYRIHISVQVSPELKDIAGIRTANILLPATFLNHRKNARCRSPSSWSATHPKKRTIRPPCPSRLGLLEWQARLSPATVDGLFMSVPCVNIGQQMPVHGSIYSAHKCTSCVAHSVTHAWRCQTVCPNYLPLWNHGGANCPTVKTGQDWSGSMQPSDSLSLSLSPESPASPSASIFGDEDERE